MRVLRVATRETPDSVGHSREGPQRPLLSKTAGQRPVSVVIEGRPRQDLNLRHLPPEGSALSPELRGLAASRSLAHADFGVLATVGLWVEPGLRLVGCGWPSMRTGWSVGLRCCFCMGIRTMRPFGMGLWGCWGSGFGLFGMTCGGPGSLGRLVGGRGIGSIGWFGILWPWWPLLGGLCILSLMTGGLFRVGLLLLRGLSFFLLIRPFLGLILIMLGTGCGRGVYGM